MTDLEASTEHLPSLGGSYGAVLGQQHDIIRSALAEHAGIEVGSEGDSFAAVFGSPIEALEAALAAQR